MRAGGWLRSVLTPPYFPIISLALALIVLSLGLTVAARHAPLRRREPAPLPGAAGAQPVAKPDLADLPPEEWTPRFIELERSGEWKPLARQLDGVRDRHAEVYASWRLGYLHGRALMEAGRLDDAAKALEPFLAPGQALRDLALYYRAEIAEEEGDDAEAARLREELVLQYPQATWRDSALSSLATYVQAHGTAAKMQELDTRLAPTIDAARRRDLEARRVEMLASAREPVPALAPGIRLLQDQLADDPAERVSRALDRPELVRRMKPEELMLLGESLRSHRHYDRALDVLGKALDRLPSRRDDLLFALGRAHFGAERYAEAEKLYLRGAAGARTGEVKATFYWHASRAAQLLGDDARAEQEMGQAIQAAGPAPAAPKRKASRRPTVKKRSSALEPAPLSEVGQARVVRAATKRAPARSRARSRAKAPPPKAGAPSPITSVSPGAAALVQRLRTRAAQKRFEEAEADLRYALQRFPDAAADATIAYAAALVAGGRAADALAALQVLPSPSDRFVASEVDYWQARAHEAAGDAAPALAEYLQVLRATVPTHFAYFARRRVADPALAARLAEELKTRGEEVDRLIAAGDVETARERQTDVVLLTPGPERPAQVAKLRSIYEKLPRYREVLELRPWDFPRFPLPEPPAPESAPQSPPPVPPEPSRLDLLLAMGLFDDAIDLVTVRWPLTPPATALTRALALHLGAAPRGSIYAAEVLMRAVPDDFVPELLPRVLRELLYPRYFYDRIVAESRKHGADPRLVLSVTREESRFDPRAKSAASARGLLQFIITTARDVGREVGLVELNAEDLYDPTIVIQLGAKYIADLARQFDDDPYRTAAAYNAGPNQVRLWARLAVEPRPDAFFTAVSFDETKNYVRKVLNSYERYAEIYEEAGPTGGLRIEP